MSAPTRRSRRNTASSKNPHMVDHGRFLALSDLNGWSYLGQSGYRLNYERPDPRSIIGKSCLHIQINTEGEVVYARLVGFNTPAVDGPEAREAALGWLTEPITPTTQGASA